jgi:hypothetical protein
MRALVVTAFVAGVGVLCAAPAADALTSTQANRIALRVLKPGKQKGRIVVFTLRRALGPRDVVFEANPRARKLVRFRRPGRARWFFWMDLNHDALFAHRSVGLTIDDHTGATRTCLAPSVASPRSAIASGLAQPERGHGRPDLRPPGRDAEGAVPDSRPVAIARAMDTPGTGAVRQNARS